MASRSGSDACANQMKTTLAELCALFALAFVCGAMWLLKDPVAAAYAHSFEGHSFAPMSDAYFNSGYFLPMIPGSFLLWLLGDALRKDKANREPLLYVSVTMLALIIVLLFALLAMVLPLTQLVPPIRHVGA